MKPKVQLPSMKTLQTRTTATVSPLVTYLRLLAHKMLIELSSTFSPEMC